MSKRPSKKAAPKKANEVKVDQLFVLGRNENGKPRGARFPEVKDDIVTAALRLNCTVVHPASASFAAVAMKLPKGRIYASGQAFIPNIRSGLFDDLTTILSNSDDTSSAHTLGKVEVSPDTPLPKNWDEVDIGSMVLIHENPEDGWWEAIVLERRDDVLRLQLRDYPKLPIYERHISAVALVNPGT
jgi:hypothetical protein